MHLGIRCIGLLFGFIALNSCAAEVAIDSPSGARSGLWTFVDMKSGASSFLSLKDERLVIAEQAIPVTFCAPSSDFYCFSSELAEFAVPKNSKKRDHWVLGDRVYCVVRRLHDVSGKPENEDGSLLIFSRKGADCAGSTPFDIVAVYSKSTGLRDLTRHLEGGGFVELLSNDRLGFGIR